MSAVIPRSKASSFRELVGQRNLMSPQDQFRELCLRTADGCDQHASFYRTHGHIRHARICEFARDSALKGNTEVAAQLTLMRQVPPTVEEVMSSPEFLGQLMEYYPLVSKDIRRINADVFTGAEPVFEAYLGGATGTGKSHTLKTTTIHQVICMSCFDPPQQLVGKPASDVMLWTLQSVDASTTKQVLYQPIRQLFEAMPYARRNMRWNKDKDAALEFDNNIWVVPGSAALNSTIGALTPGGAFDEFSFLQRIANSARAGQAGGTWDQAEEVYKNISRRRRRGMTTRGIAVGVLCFASSVKYAADFLESRMTTAEEKGAPNTVSIRHRQFDVMPARKHSGARFHLLVGTEEYATRVLGEHERAGIDYPAAGRVEDVPVEYKVDFERDPEGALRDVLGVASQAISPFIARRDTVKAAFARGVEEGMQPLLARDVSVLATHGMPLVIEKNLPDAAI